MTPLPLDSSANFFTALILSSTLVLVVGWNVSRMISLFQLTLLANIRCFQAIQYLTTVESRKRQKIIEVDGVIAEE
jgi:hypothetical protein